MYNFLRSYGLIRKGSICWYDLLIGDREMSEPTPLTDFEQLLIEW
jgi:hypothetical protein